MPYTGANQQELALAHIRDRIPSVSELNPNVPDKLAKMVLRAMAKDRQDRFRDADQLGNVLRDFREKSMQPGSVKPQVSEPSNPQQSQPATPNPTASTEPRNIPPGNRPPGIGIPPAPTQRGNNAEVTAKYSAAPQAPPPYDPRRPYQQGQQSPPSVPNPITQQPQAFEQRYVAPPIVQQPQQQQYVPQQNPQAQNYPAPPSVPSDSGHYAAQYSRPMPVEDDDTGFDYVTLVLAFIAILAFLGLIPVWIWVLASR